MNRWDDVERQVADNLYAQSRVLGAFDAYKILRDDYSFKVLTEYVYQMQQTQDVVFDHTARTAPRAERVVREAVR